MWLVLVDLLSMLVESAANLGIFCAHARPNLRLLREDLHLLFFIFNCATLHPGVLGALGGDFFSWNVTHYAFPALVTLIAN